MLKYLLLVCLFIMGCGTGMYQYHKVPTASTSIEVMPLYIDKDFSDAERIELQSVINEWNAALNGYVKIIVVSWKFDRTDKKEAAVVWQRTKITHEGVMVLKMSDNDPLLEDVDLGEKLAFTNGLGMDANLLIVLQDRIGYKKLHTILLHEFGHLLGANHTNAVSLMFPSYDRNTVPCIDKETMAQVANYHKIPLQNLSYCSTPEFE